MDDAELAEQTKEWRLRVLEALQSCGPPPTSTIESGLLARWALVTEWLDKDGAEWLTWHTGQGNGTTTTQWWTTGALAYAFEEGDDE